LRRINAILDKVGTGTIPAATLRETNNLIDGLIDAKHGAIVQGARMVSANTGLDPAKDHGDEQVLGRWPRFRT